MLERVAHRRAVYWEQVPRDWASYDVLLGLPDCNLLGRRGWLAIGHEIKSALVVDCARPEHKAVMIENKLIDANLIERGEGWLVLRK